MNSGTRVFAAIAALLAGAQSFVATAKDIPISGMAIQQIQARDFEAPVSVVFPAVMTILQDAGFRIQTADRDTGLITAIGPSKGYLTWLPFIGFGQGKKIPIVSAYVEQRATNLTRARLNFVMSSGKSQLAFTDETPVLDPPVYREAFERIEKEIFVRQAMSAPTPPLPPSPPPTPRVPLPVAKPSAPMPDSPRQWRQAAYSPDLSIAFVDGANVRMTGETVRFWVNLYYRPNQGTDSLISLREAQCADQTFRDIWISYSLKGQAAGIVDRPSGLVKVEAGSVNAEILLAACGKRQLGKMFENPAAAASLYFENRNW